MRDFLKFWKNFFNLRKRAEHLTLKSTLHRFLKRLFAVYTFTDRRRSQTFLTSSSKHEFQLCVNYALHFNGIAAAIPILRRLVLDTRLLKSAGERDGALRTLFWTLPWDHKGGSNSFAFFDRSRKEGISRRLTNRRSESKRIIALRNARNLRISAKRYPR